MRQITVSTPVFARIWALRISGEESEDQILCRILKSEVGEPETVTRLGQATSENSSKPEVSDMFAIKRVGKIRWVDDVYDALVNLGGQASLKAIYVKVESIRKNSSRTTPKALEATIRRTLEDNSKDSDNFRGQDIFMMPLGRGAGIWAIRKNKN